MQEETNLKRTGVRQRLIVILLLVASVALVGLMSVGRLNVPSPFPSAGVSKNPLALLSPGTYSELLAIDPSRLEDCDVALINLLCADGLPNAQILDVQANLALLDNWASRVKSETLRHLYRFQRHPAEFEHSEGYFRMLMMAVVLYEDCQVRYNPERIAMLGQAAMGDGFFADSQDVFLHGLLGPRRMGTCSSMPVLYVALGRRLGYPLKLVATKGHLFVRWESPAERFNIDATGRGVNRNNDEYYRNWPFQLSDAEVKEHGYLKSLSAAEELAVFLSIRGHCLMEGNRYAEAVASLEQALHLDPASHDLFSLLTWAESKSDLNRPSQSVAARTAPADFREIASQLGTLKEAGFQSVLEQNPLRQIP